MRRARPYLAALLLALVAAGGARAFELDVPRVLLREARLVARLAIRGELPWQALSAVEDGIPVRVIWELRLRRHVGFFLASDPVLHAAEFAWTVRYDLLEGRYSVKGSTGKVDRSFARRAELLEFMVRSPELDLVDFTALVPDKTYYLEARARVESVKLYPPFNFLSILAHETEWTRSAELVR